MTYKELQTKYQQIFEFLSKSRIKDALDILLILANECRNRDFKSQLDSYAETYINMLKYAFELGDDPQKESVYNRLIKEIMELADDAREDIIRTHNLLNSYQLKIIPDSLSEQVVTDIAEMVERLILLNETDTESDERKGVEEIYKSSEYKENIRALFRLIWHADKLRYTEIDLLNKLSKPANIAWHDKCIVVSALTLSLIRHFDSKKVDILLEFYDSGEKQVWQRALTGLVLGLTFHNSRIRYYPEILQRLKSLQGDKRSNTAVEIIIQQYIKAKETEKITRKIQEEIIPEMIKIKSKLEEKLDLENLISFKEHEDKNPEWETFFKDSPDVYNKLEEFSNMQMEGADVFLGAFAMLKNFEFFRQINNWFLPFYKENDHVSSTFESFGSNIDPVKFSEGIERSNFLCNSDKYSFCLNVKHMPDFQKSSVMELFNMELQAMNEMAASDELINTDAQAKVIITQYFQDLYRFYKLHPLRAEFNDIFKITVPVYEAEFFEVWIDDPRVLRNIGEFYFEKDYFQDALIIFEKLLEDKNNYELFEKIAYCYQQLEEYEKALEFYHKAELLDKNKLWLINRIAWCYRKSGDLKKASEYYHEAEKLEPENLEIQAHLGHIYLEMEEYKKSLKYYFKVEYLQPENAKVNRPISWCSFMMGKLDNAVRYLEKSLLHQAGKHDFMNLAHIYWCLGDKQKAIENYRHCLSSSKMDVDWFTGTMNEDSKYLAPYGIKQMDILLMIDYIRLSVNV